MTYIRIKGGKRICGEVTLQGSKNAVLPMIAASILIRGVTVIENCPDITDVREMLMQLQQTGARYTFYDHVLVIDCSEVFLYDGEKKEASKTRGSVLFLGAFLGRFSEARISYPGGCVIGSRPIDLHCELLRSLGVTISEQEDALYACGRPAGAELFLRSPSVGATENAILAAVCAKGRTVLHGAATEPEVPAAAISVASEPIAISHGMHPVTRLAIRQPTNSPGTAAGVKTGRTQSASDSLS